MNTLSNIKRYRCSPPNYRTYDLEVNGRKTQISAMVRPTSMPNRKWKWLFQPAFENHTSMISIVDSADKENELQRTDEYSEQIRKIAQNCNRDEHTPIFSSLTLGDFGSGSIDLYDEFYRKANTVSQEDGKCIIHCLAGNGRSGTLIASLFIREQVDQLAPEKLKGLLNAEINHPVSLGVFDERSTQEIKNDTFHPVAIKALHRVRVNAECAVETPKQLKQLSAYANHLIKLKLENTKEYNLLKNQTDDSFERLSSKKTSKQSRSLYRKTMDFFFDLWIYIGIVIKRIKSFLTPTSMPTTVNIYVYSEAKKPPSYEDTIKSDSALISSKQKLDSSTTSKEANRLNISDGA